MAQRPFTPLNPGGVLRTLRRGRRAWLAALAGLIVLAAWADRRWPVFHQADDWRRYHGRTFRVAFVIDGDTLDVAAADGDRATTRVRLWGINAPEIAHPQFGRATDDPLGPEAAALARKLADGQMVELELEPQRPRDSFGGLLAYVRLPGGKYLNEELLAQGLAAADNRPGDARFEHRRMQRYELIQRQAQQQRRGLWAQSPLQEDQPDPLSGQPPVAEP